MNLLEKCFEGTKETPPRLRRVKPLAEKADAHMEKAITNLLAMDLMEKNKFFDWAITCGYYAMYHATMAALWLLGLEARSHECVIAAFEAFYVKKGKVDERYLQYVKRAKTLSGRYSDALENAKAERIIASYGLGEIRSQEAAKVTSDAREFVNGIRGLVFEAKGEL